MIIRLWLKDVNTFCLGVTDKHLQEKVRRRLSLYNMVINCTAEEERAFWSTDIRAFQYPNLGKLGEGGVHETYVAIEVAKYKAAMALRIVKTELRLNPDLSFAVLRHKTDMIYRELPEGQSKNKPAGEASERPEIGTDAVSGGKKKGGRSSGSGLRPFNMVKLVVGGTGVSGGKKIMRGGSPLRNKRSLVKEPGALRGGGGFRTNESLNKADCRYKDGFERVANVQEAVSGRRSDLQTDTRRLKLSITPLLHPGNKLYSRYIDDTSRRTQFRKPSDSSTRPVMKIQVFIAFMCNQFNFVSCILCIDFAPICSQLILVCHLFCSGLMYSQFNSGSRLFCINSASVGSQFIRMCHLYCFDLMYILLLVTRGAPGSGEVPGPPGVMHQRYIRTIWIDHAFIHPFLGENGSDLVPLAPLHLGGIIARLSSPTRQAQCLHTHLNHSAR